MIQRAGQSVSVRVLAALALLSGPVLAGGAENAQDLVRLSLEELGEVQVTSVSKSTDLLRAAPAAIYVITHEDLHRAGVTSISEALRLAPNLHVTQVSSSNYVVAARGFSGSPEAQNFSNKLLILIDGRSVYSPLYSGVYLDVQDTFIEDIERIEVISGPGATLWGANAMNGVINIITRAAYLTEGGMVRAGAGNKEQTLAARFGDQTPRGFAYRFYGKAFHRGAMELDDGASAQDGWFKVQGGARVDWARGSDTYTVQGDAYRGTQNQLGLQDQTLIGANALMRWQRSTDVSDIQFKAYVDQTQRAAPTGGVAFVLQTYDVELQQSILVGPAHRVVWGGGARLNNYGITNSIPLAFIPPKRDLTLVNIFAQDTVTLDAVRFTFGAKLEKDPYSGWELLPDARVSWDLSDKAMLWAAGSQAIRSPTPFDQDVVETVGGLVFLTGNPDFKPEQVEAFELGYRGLPHEKLSLSVSAFYNRYDNLRTIEPAPSPAFLPLRWGNLMDGYTYGVEAWANWQLTANWRLSPGIRSLHRNLKLKTGASGLLGLSQAGNDPKIQATLASSFDFSPDVSMDAQLRYGGERPAPLLDDYLELNARIGWRVTESLELALSGQNLLQDSHKEVPAPYGEEIVRTLFLQANWAW